MKIGTIFTNLFRPVPPQPVDPVQLIAGGPNAPHLAQRPKDWEEGLIDGGGWAAQVKLDGIRCLHIDGRLVTLEGQPFNAARHCLPALRDLESTYDEPMFFDMEYVEEDGFDATVSAYKKGEGQGVCWVFDAVPMREWHDDRGTLRWSSRTAQLHAHYVAAKSPWVGVLESFDVCSDVTARHLFTKMRTHGHEGIVLKRRASLYRRQRNDDWLRMKPCETTDMRLIDIEGNDKAGARRLVCQDVSGPVILTSGFSAERATIWANRDLLLGDEHLRGVMVEVEHNGRTAKGKPRHARFSKLRQDRQPGGVPVQEGR